MAMLQVPQGPSAGATTRIDEAASNMIWILGGAFRLRSEKRYQPDKHDRSRKEIGSVTDGGYWITRASQRLEDGLPAERKRIREERSDE